MTVITPSNHAADAFTIAAKNLDQVVARLTPNPKAPTVPTLTWGNDKGTFELLHQTTGLLDSARDEFSTIFTRRQAGKLIDSLGSDLKNVFALRNFAMTVDGGAELRKYVTTPTLTPAVLKDLTKAATDARAAVAMLQGNLG